MVEAVVATGDGGEEVDDGGRDGGRHPSASRLAMEPMRMQLSVGAAINTETKVSQL